MCVDVACVRASEVCWSGFEGGLLGGCLGFGRGVGCLCDYMVLPLLNSSFEPGRAREVVEGFVDVDLRNIARAELFYFTGRAEECCEITRGGLLSCGFRRVFCMGILI